MLILSFKYTKTNINSQNKITPIIKDSYYEVIKKLLHWDATVIIVATNRSCLRFYGTENLDVYTTHENKNKEGLDEDGILNVLAKDTVVIHNYNKVNYNEEYKFKNAECNRHLISTLKKVIDKLNHKWAKDLIELLIKMNHKRNCLIKKEKEEFSQEELKQFKDKFKKIMIEAHKENEKEEQKYYVDTETTLILRILDFKNQYLLWIYDFDIPFTNNLSK